MTKKIEGIVNGGFVLRSGGKSRYKANRPSGNMIRVIDLEGSALSHVYQFNSKLKVKIAGAPSIFRIQRNQISPMTNERPKVRKPCLSVWEELVKRHFDSLKSDFLKSMAIKTQKGNSMCLIS